MDILGAGWVCAHGEVFGLKRGIGAVHSTQEAWFAGYVKWSRRASESPAG
jgi:hypothetical protein